jgi:hypothetical protein
MVILSWNRAARQSSLDLFLSRRIVKIGLRLIVKSDQVGRLVAAAIDDSIVY